MKKIILIVVAAILALVSGVVAQYQLSSDKIQSSNLPTFNLPDLSGQKHNLAEWQGKIIIVNFWATWCPPCRKEIPEFVALQNEYQAQNIQFIGIAIEEKEPVEEYLDFVDINYPILIAGDEGVLLSQQFGNQVGAVPFSVVINQQGKIIHHQAGEFKREKILEIIQPLL